VEELVSRVAALTGMSVADLLIYISDPLCLPTYNPSCISVQMKRRSLPLSTRTACLSRISRTSEGKGFGPCRAQLKTEQDEVSRLRDELDSLEKEKLAEQERLESLLHKHSELQAMEQKRAEKAEAQFETLTAKVAKWEKTLAKFNSDLSSKSRLQFV
jgi:hypothetical protein